MTGLLSEEPWLIDRDAIRKLPREGWANVNDPQEMRDWLDTLPDEQFYEIEFQRQQAEQVGQMDEFYRFIQRVMQ